MKDFSKLVVSIGLFNITIYTVVVLYIFSKTGNEPEVLTRYFFGAWVGELGVVGLIKVFKVRMMGCEKSDESS